MNMPHLSKTLVAAVSSLIIVSLTGGLFGWLVLRIQATTLTLSRSEAERAELEHDRQNIHSLEETIEKNKPETDRIAHLFINHDRPLDFLEELTNLGTRTHSKVVLDYSEQESTRESLLFRVTIEGSKTDVLRYLRFLEFMPYAITVEGVNWQNIGLSETSSKKESDTRLLLTLRVKTRTENVLQ